MKANETLLSKFRMQFAWTFVAFAGLKRGKFGSLSDRKSSSDETESNGTFNLLPDERSSYNSMIIDDESERSDFAPPKGGTVDFRQSCEIINI